MSIPFKHYEVYYNYKYPDGVFRQRIGLVRSYDKDAEKQYALGKLIVDDYILPEAKIVKIENVTPINDVIPAGTKPDNYRPIDCVITDAWQKYWCDLANEASAKLTKLGVGAQFIRPVGDGHAHYIVTGLRKRRSECQVEWRGFSGDRWVDQVFGMGGWFRTKDVEPLCSFGDDDLFTSYEGPGSKTWAELERRNWVPQGMIQHTLQEA